MSHISKNPEYAGLVQEINDLAAASGKIRSRIAIVESALRAGAPDDGTSHVEAALKFAETGVTVVPTDTPAELREEHQILRTQRDALDKAIRARRSDLDKLTADLSRAASSEAQDTHRDIAARYLAALNQLDEIAQEEVDLIHAIGRDGYEPSFRQYVAWPHIGRLSESSASAIWHKVRDLSRYAK